MNLEKRPTWELKNIVKALSLHSWLNTEEEKKRLFEAQKILRYRVKLKLFEELFEEVR